MSSQKIMTSNDGDDARDAPRREEEGRREKEGWLLVMPKSKRESKRRRKKGFRRREMNRLGFDRAGTRAGGARELGRNLSGGWARVRGRGTCRRQGPSG